MAINAKEAPSNGRSQDPVDPGTYPGRLVQIIDYGLQPQQYNGESKPPAREIGTTYELLDEFMKDEDGNDIEDKPRWLSETFVLHNLSADKAKSTARYLALDPKINYDGDWSKLLGTAAMITVVNKPGTGKNKGKVYNNIATVSTMREKEAAKAPDLVNDPRFFDLEDTSEDNIELFYTFPDWIVKKIKSGLEFEGSAFADALHLYGPSKVKKDKKDDKKPARKQESVEEDDSEEEDGNY